jgi:hypothetical protein
LEKKSQAANVHSGCVPCGFALTFAVSNE